MKPVKSKIGEKLVEMKGRKEFDVTIPYRNARMRPELQLEQCIGGYKLSVIPKSLFPADGQPLHCTDKAEIMHLTENMVRGRRLGDQ